VKRPPPLLSIKGRGTNPVFSPLSGVPEITYDAIMWRYLCPCCPPPLSKARREVLSSCTPVPLSLVVGQYVAKSILFQRFDLNPVYYWLKTVMRKTAYPKLKLCLYQGCESGHFANRFHQQKTRKLPLTLAA